MCLQVKQARTAARYEKMVLRANEWMVEQGYAAFCEVVEESDNKRFLRYKEELGRGAFKTVYKGYDDEEGVEVAWNKLPTKALFLGLGAGTLPSLLLHENADYVAVELDHVAHGRDLQRALARLTGVSTVPQVFIDGQFVGTADGTREALASGRLARLLNARLPETAVELCASGCVARCDVRGNLGECGVILNRGDDWLKDRWQAASDMGGTAIPGPHKVEIEFGRDVRVCSVEIDWETAYAEDYTIAADGVRVDGVDNEDGGDL